MLAGLRFLTGWIQPVGYKYSESFSNSVPGMLERPSLAYRFGLESETDVPIGENRLNPFSGEKKNYEFSSGFTFLGGIATTVAFKESVSQDLIRQGDRTRSTSTSWPDLNIRIQRFTTLPLLKPIVNKFIDIFAPKTSYSRSIKETENIDDGFTTDRNETQSYSPLLSINFKLLRTLSFSGSYTYSRTMSESYNRTTGLLQTETRSERKSIAFTGQWQFSAPAGIAIPLFGKVKFKSDVKISVNVKRNASKSETSREGGPWAISTDKSDFSVSPVISYTFSRQVTGGLKGRWQDTNDAYQNRKSHIRELQIWAEIRF